MAETFTLKNGLRVVAENIPGLSSVSVGVWIKAGSMMELPHERGLSHLMEHMAFKGTTHRTARQLAEDMDALGGQVNAATGRTSTMYYARMLDEELPKGIELLADITCNASMPKEELEKERKVILEEIAMVEDMPEEVIFDLINEALYRGGTLAHPILGDKSGISRYSLAEVLAFKNTYYTPHNALLSVAGHVDIQQLRSLAEEHFGHWQGGTEQMYPDNTVNAAPIVLAVDKQSEQTHLCLGYRGVAEGSADRYALAAFSNILGGGMSSRLFQTIREEHALVYTVFSSPTGYPGCGDFIIYAAATPENASSVVREIHAVCNCLLEEGITGKELEQTKVLLKTNIVLAEESAYHRMQKLGNDELVFKREIPVKEMLDKVDAVTREDVLRLAKQTLSQKPSAALIGPNASKLKKQLEEYHG